MNQKYTMFENYHIAAKEFANGDMEVYGRLMYIINCYGIENIELDDLSAVEKLFFTSVKASIDKSIDISEKRSSAGSKKSADKTSEKSVTKTEKSGKKICRFRFFYCSIAHVCSAQLYCVIYSP